MKANDLRKMSPAELQKKDKDLREDYSKLKFQNGIRRMENPSRLGQLRKEIARVQTVMKEFSAK
ncbi:MAG: 50S ribosomal protein L29 [Desulfobulbus sp.]|jgi:large subunit ribosomal protein L29|nr:MAG: 50S ribosomal protein L29 [Desulfobulbus sp.]